MKLGSLSISLAVKDIQASKAFYEALGFTEAGGDIEQNWLILRNEDSHTIGLFQGMFENNLMTFNPGWDANAQETENFIDIREIQKHLKNNGVALLSEADEDSSGPANCLIEDPDGNQILLDQHR